MWLKLITDNELLILEFDSISIEFLENIMKINKISNWLFQNWSIEKNVRYPLSPLILQLLLLFLSI